MKKWLLLNSRVVFIILCAVFCRFNINAQTKWITHLDTNNITHVRAIISNGITTIGLMRTLTTDSNDAYIDLLLAKINPVNGKVLSYLPVIVPKKTSIVRFIPTANDILVVNSEDSCFYFTGHYRDSYSSKIYHPYLCKLNKFGNIVYIHSIQDSIHVRDASIGISILSNNKIAIGTVNTDTSGGWTKSFRFGLTIIDSLGNIISRREYPKTYGSDCLMGLQKDNSNNLYLMGMIWETSDIFFNELLPIHYILKVNSFGDTIKTKFLPNLINVSPLAQITKISELSINPKFITIYGKHNSDMNGHYRGIFHDNIIFSFIDSNLDMYRRINLHTNAYRSIMNAKYIGNGKILISGSRFVDNYDYSVPSGNVNFPHAWLAIMDTNGNFIWDRTYAINDTDGYYFEFVSIDKDGSIYACGNSENKKTFEEKGLMIKVDSNGCLDLNFCYPMGVHEVLKIPEQYMVLYPNPAQNNITLQITNDVFIGGTANIYNSEGQLLQKINKVSKQQNINISGYAIGNYYLQYSIGDWRSGQQFIVR